jgi:RNA polymerase sigma-70 factor (ECF subfamily)
MPFLEDNRSTDEPGPAATMESRDTEQSLLKLLDRLTPNQQEVIRLKFQNDLSYKEIADLTQLSVTNVGFILHTGLRKLREIVRSEPDFADLPIKSAAL